MPRFFFNIHDGASLPDTEGVVLHDIQAARAQAIRTSGELLCDIDPRSWDGDRWRMEVSDRWDHILFVMRFSAEARPAIPSGPPALAVGPSSA